MVAPGICVRGLTGCPPRKLAAVRRAVARIRQELVVGHRILVTVTPSADIYNPFNRRPCVGLFIAEPLATEKTPQIILAGGESVSEITLTLLHEWVHYMQWAAGKELTERGVNVRAKCLVKKLGLGWI